MSFRLVKFGNESRKEYKMNEVSGNVKYPSIRLTDSGESGQGGNMRLKDFCETEK